MEANETISPKEKLEIEKLQIEIKDIKRRIIPQWIASFGPWFIGLLTIFLAYRSGFIDNKATLNEIKAARVEAQVKEFEARRDSLHRSNDSLLILNSRLSFERQKLKEDSQRLNLAFEQMKNDKRSKSGQVADLVIKVDELKKSKIAIENQLTLRVLNFKKNISDTATFYERQSKNQFYSTGNTIDQLVSKNHHLSDNLAECEILRRRMQAEIDNLKKQINSIK